MEAAFDVRKNMRPRSRRPWLCRRRHGQPDRMTIVVVISLIGSVIFSFVDIARPMTRLNGGARKDGRRQSGHRDSGADRGDEIGDVAKTVS